MRDLFTETLPCKLEYAEVAQKSEMLARTVHELRSHQAHMKEVSSDLKAEEKRITASVDKLAEEVTTRIERRPVECYEVALHARMLVEIIRRDTSEVVRTRPMEPQEREDSRQGKLFGYGDEDFRREAAEHGERKRDSDAPKH